VSRDRNAGPGLYRAEGLIWPDSCTTSGLRYLSDAREAQEGGRGTLSLDSRTPSGSRCGESGLSATPSGKAKSCGEPSAEASAVLVVTLGAAAASAT
jgi:hypothetical protein